jgi:hypothetical protein
MRAILYNSRTGAISGAVLSLALFLPFHAATVSLNPSAVAG